MKLFLMFALLVAVGISEAAISIGRVSTHPDYPNKCYDEKNKIAYDVGTHYPNGTCLELVCTGAFRINTYTCGVVGAPSGYHNEIDLSKPYPNCCVNIVKDKE